MKGEMIALSMSIGPDFNSSVNCCRFCCNLLFEKIPNKFQNSLVVHDLLRGFLGFQERLNCIPNHFETFHSLWHI